jgi:uncharacterized tellurite resistance protein B-like protein
MFDFLKTKPDNPIYRVFSDLSSNQKMSVINLLLSITLSDPEEEFNRKEIDYLNRYLDFLGLNQQKCNAYLASGQQKIINDLKNISQFQKEFLVVAVYEMLTSSGNTKPIKIYMATRIFAEIGISEEKFTATISKTQTQMKQFFNR